MLLSDLPSDIIVTIFPLLPNPKDFLSLCSINKAFYTYRLEPSYWRPLTSSTFRIPVSPLLRADGRWHWLYKKLKTQTVAYSWGQDGNGCLGLEGHEPIQIEPPPVEVDEHGVRLPVPIGRWMHRRLPAPTTKHAYPEEMYVPNEVGIIADLQCGGWSTSILTSTGDIWSVGILDAADGRRLGQPAQVLTKLQWGRISENSSEIAPQPIKQFSSGRRHILGLDDSGKVWHFDQIHQAARHIEFLTEELINAPEPTRVVAGWQSSSAFVPQCGIVYWQPPIFHDGQPQPGLELKVIPRTASGKDDAGSRNEPEESTLSMAIGSVLSHIALENYIVYLTSTSKVFAFELSTEPSNTNPFEITSLSSALNPATKQPLENYLDIQGSFRRFAVFSSTGTVKTCDAAYLDTWFSVLRSGSPSRAQDPASSHLLDPPPLIQALQSNAVISLAFGDYHFHALHSTGAISSYGDEPSSCGVFGLGPAETVGRLRGMVPPQWGIWRGNSKMSEQGMKGLPRQIWFEEEKRLWAESLVEAAQDKGWIPKRDGHVGRTASIGRGRARLLQEQRQQQEQPQQPPEPTTQTTQQVLDEEEWAGLSEWIEQEGRTWAKAVGSSSAQNNEVARANPSEAPLGAYFAVGVSAAGWHSGALVLVDRDAAEKNFEDYRHYQEEGNIASSTGERSEKYRKNGELPTLRLPSGTVLRGSERFPSGQVGEGSSSSRLAETEQETVWKMGLPQRLYTSADAANA